MITLVAFKNNSTRRDIPLKPGTTVIIGRKPDADIRIPLNEVSRAHCELCLNGSKATIKDLGSSNGTYVNEARIEGEISLKAGDRITVGPVLFVVQIDGSPSTIVDPNDISTKPVAPPKPPTAAPKPAAAAAAPKPAAPKPAPPAASKPLAGKPASAPKPGAKTPIDADDFDIDDLSDLDLGGLPELDLNDDDLSDLLGDDVPPAKKGPPDPKKNAGGKK